MFHIRKMAGLMIVGAMVIAGASAIMRADDDRDHEHDHLDSIETRRAVRHLEERNDDLMDHIVDWIGDRDERRHDSIDMLHSAQQLDEQIAQLKIDLYHHDEPWELRDNVRHLIDSAMDLRHSMERGEWSRDLLHQWRALREEVNALARQYHLDEVN